MSFHMLFVHNTVVVLLETNSFDEMVLHELHSIVHVDATIRGFEYVSLFMVLAWILEGSK